MTLVCFFLGGGSFGWFHVVVAVGFGDVLVVLLLVGLDCFMVLVVLLEHSFCFIVVCVAVFVMS